MVNKLLLPQEIETFYVIPALRKHLAIALKRKGMKQKDIAALFGINTAAISQYTSNKRGDKIILNAEVLAEIKKSASLIKDRLSYIKETQKILNIIRESQALCRIHKQFSHTPEDCDVQETGCHPRLACLGKCPW